MILQGQGKVRKFYFESGKIDILKKSQGKLNYNFIYLGWLEEILQVTVISPFSCLIVLLEPSWKCPNFCDLLKTYQT